MIRKPGRLARAESAGRTISVKMSPAEEDAVDAALLPGESRSAMIRSAALDLARRRRTIADRRIAAIARKVG